MFRLRLVAPILAGVYTITAHAHGSAFFVKDAALLRPFLWGEFALMMLLAGGYLMNDLCDLTHDLVNRPEKVYLDHAISQKAARVSVAILFAGSLSAAAMVNPACLGVIDCQTAAFVVYNLFSKRISWGKPVYVSLLLVSIYPLSFALAGGGVQHLGLRQGEAPGASGEAGRRRGIDQRGRRGRGRPARAADHREGRVPGNGVRPSFL